MANTEVTNRRKLTNVFIDPRTQLFLFTPYLVTVIGFVVTNFLIVRYVIAALGRAEPNGGIDPTEIYFHLSLYSGVGLITAGVLGFILCLVVSHRLLGPLYNIQRHVRRLKSGEYHHAITLRKGDRLGELADDLNVVTTRLSALAGSSSPKS